jgi:hypothetical protein
MMLGDRIFVLLVERGPLPACEIALASRRRKADVIAALRSDPRFVHTGRRRASLWAVAPVPSLSVDEAALRWDCDIETATEIIFGPEGFLEQGLVASLNGNGRVIVTARGLEAAARLEALNPVEAA